VEFRVLHILSGDLWGGAEAQMALQISAQRALGIDARALLFNSGETSRRYADRSIPVLQLHESEGFFQLLRASTQAAGDFAPELTVSHGYKETIVAAALKRRLGIPFVSTFHGWSESYRGTRWLKMLVYETIYLFLSRHVASGSITVTDALRKELKLDACVIQNVAEAPPVEIAGTKSTAGLDPRRRSVVCVGRLVPVKRLDRAIDAFAELLRQWEAHFGPKPMLYLIGEGELEAALRQRSAALGLHSDVSFLGFRNDVLRLISEADALLLTSESEGLPTVLIEAMLAGTPMVLTDLPGIREALARGTAYPALLVSHPAPSEYAAALMKILREPIDPGGDLLRRVHEWFHPERAAREAIDYYRARIGG